MTTKLDIIAEGIWLAEGEIVSFYGFAYPTRSVVVRLTGGDLWVWSPIALNDSLANQIDQLGPVAHIVSPNKIHHLYLQDWKARYPTCAIWGPRTTINKRRDLDFREPLTGTPPPVWQADLDQAWFRGSPAMDEIVFLHRASRTVVVADLIENFTDDFLDENWSWWQRLLARLDGITSAKPGAPREWRLSFIHRGQARHARGKVLGWPCERVVMAHGDWQRADGHAFLARAFAWLGR